ncbi:MAG: hypothetical protein R3E89_05670 [Thiolinea sp.]
MCTPCCQNWARPQLIEHGGKHQGKLVFPYGYGVVLSHITRQQFSETDLQEVLPWNRVLCKDEMLEATDPEDFQRYLWNMFDYQFSRPLTVPQLDRLRWHIFPEIRIAEQVSLFADNPETTDDTDSDERL